MTFGEKVRTLRLKSKMTQDELAEKMGYKSFTTIQKWESGDSMPRFGNIKKLADIFNVSVDYFADEPNKPLDLSTLSPQARQVITSMNKLNSLGQDKVVDYADDLTHNSQYSKLQETPVTYQMAANDGNLSDEDREEILNMIKELKEEENE